jgi:hypothetical protein
VDLDEFRSELKNRVAIWSEADGNFTHSSFVDVAVELLSDAGEVSDFEPCYYRGMSGRRSVAVDGYAFDPADGSVRLFIAWSEDDARVSLTQSDATALFGRLRAFIEDSIAGKLRETIDDNSPARELADELRRRAPSLLRIRAFLLTDAQLSSRIKDWPEGAVADIPLEYHIWDITRFHRAFDSRTGQDELVVDFTEHLADGLPCLEASTISSPYSGFLCVIPGEVLAGMYNRYGSRLLEGNVRSFLSTKVRVNKGIRNTILKHPEMFFAYNNGIAATASAVNLRRTERGIFLISATDLQIVNGGQTTASLAVNQKDSRGNVALTFVPMKLSVVDPERSVEMIPLISRFANSQNKVSEADFFANHQFHRRMEVISRRIWAPAKSGSHHETHWFYERARGQYFNAPLSLRDTQRKAFVRENPRGQLVTKTDLAKSELSWAELPHRVSRGAQSAFMDFAASVTTRWDADGDLFNEEYFRQAIARIIAFRRTEALVLGQSWYLGGYRANVVTYTLAKLVHDVAKLNQGVIDLRAIWQKQAISQALERQLERTSKAVYDEITRPREGQQNVTQWCKREECWDRVRSLECAVLETFVAELVPATELRSSERAARQLQQVDSGIDAQTSVISLGLEFWNRALKWCQDHGSLATADERALKAAAGHYGSLPTERQCRRLLELKKQFEDDGFALAIG